MKKLFLIFLLSAFSLSALAAQRITLTVTVTNVAVFPNTFVYNGVTKTWTNSTTLAPTTTILIGSHTNVCATNLFTALTVGPLAGPVALAWTRANQFTITAPVDGALVASLTGTWGFLTLSTQTVTTLIPVRIPVSSAPTAAMRTNIAAGLVDAINSYPSNWFFSGGPAFTNLMGLTNVSVIAPFATKTWLNTNSFTNSLWWSGNISNSTVVMLSGMLSNIWGLRMFITNSFLDRINVGIVTNGYFTNAIIDTPKLTNAVNYGNAFSSVGSGSGSDQFGAAARAYGTFGLAIGNSAVSSNNYSSAFGWGSIAAATYSSAIGAGSLVPSTAEAGVAVGVGASLSEYATNAMALGFGAIAGTNGAVAIGRAALSTFVDSVAIGRSATTTASNQIMLGTSTIDVVVNHQLQVNGWLTNSTFTGTNLWPGQMLFTSTARTGLANGNNSGIVLGTNVFVRLSGASTIVSIAGFAAEPDGSHKFITLRGAVTNNILNESGVDAVAANRIQTGTGGTIVMTNAPATLELLYDATAARWIVIKASN